MCVQFISYASLTLMPSGKGDSREWQGFEWKDVCPESTLIQIKKQNCILLS